LKVHELEEAEREIIKVVQSRCFNDELLSLQGSASEATNPLKIKSVQKSSHICKLDPILLRGLICLGGRLQRSTISEDAKHPVKLPKQHHVSDLIIRHYHLRCGHSGLEHTLSMMREILDCSSENLPTPSSERMLPLQEDTGIRGTTEDGKFARGQSLPIRTSLQPCWSQLFWPPACTSWKKCSKEIWCPIYLSASSRSSYRSCS